MIGLRMNICRGSRFYQALLLIAAFSAGRLWFRSLTFSGSARAAATAQVIARVDDVPVGGSLIFKYPADDNPARLLVRVDEETFVAYEQCIQPARSFSPYRCELGPLS